MYLRCYKDFAPIGPVESALADPAKALALDLKGFKERTLREALSN